MADSNRMSMAEANDRKMQAVALIVFLVGLKYAISATAHLVDDVWKSYLDTAELVMMLPALIFVLGFLFWKFARLTRQQRKELLSPEGYVFESFQKACVRSWAATFIFLNFWEVFAKKLLLGLPTEFFIQVTIFFTLTVFSGVFFFLNRLGGVDELEEDSVG